MITFPYFGITLRAVFVTDVGDYLVEGCHLSSMFSTAYTLVKTSEARLAPAFLLLVGAVILLVAVDNSGLRYGEPIVMEQ